MSLNSGTWSAVVKKKYLTSSTFKALDSAVKAYLLDKSKLPGMKAAWVAWTKKFTKNGGTYKDSDRYVVGGALDDIAALVAPNQSGGIGSLATHAISKGGGGLRHITPVGITAPTPIHIGDHVTAIGWTYVAYDASDPNHSWAGAVNPMTKPLNYSQTSRINESIRRARAACELARNALIDMPRDPAVWTDTPQQAAYRAYFGAPTKTRFLAVLENFSVLSLAFAGHPNVVDIRGTTAGVSCYAACLRKNLKAKVNGSLSLTGRVDIFLGDAFLAGGIGLGQYDSSTDATVGTLLHEFAHGALKAVDAPRVNAQGTGWTQAPSNMTPGHDDYGLSPDPWSNQASTDLDDQNLAKFAPDVAIRNADNYGQFARAILTEKGL